MPEYIRALIVILGLSFPIFYFAKAAVVDSCMSLDEFVRRRNLWIGITVAGFLSQNYWIFVVITIFLVFSAAKKDKNRIALFFFICLTLPQVNVAIPGLGGIQYFLTIDYLRLITVILLLPVCIVERKLAIKHKSKVSIPDIFLASYLIYIYILDVQSNSITGSIRVAFELFIDVVLPYYSVSRHVKTLNQIKNIIASFLVAALLVALIGVFEFFRGWILYASIGDALGVMWDPGYLARGDYIRALGTSGQAIVFGYVMTLAILFYCSLFEDVTNKKIYIGGLVVLLGGVVAPLSKGPWVGLLVGGVILLITSKNVAKNTVKAIVFFAPLVLLMSFTDSGTKAISYLPFIGDLDEGSFTYREQLFSKSINIVLDNPFFGSTDFLNELEEMRNGAGIIDLVNTFLVIALRSGLIGLFLFSSFFLSVGKLFFKNEKDASFQMQYSPIARSLIAANIAILVIIATVSPIYHVPLFMWTVPALSLAYWRISSLN